MDWDWKDWNFKNINDIENFFFKDWSFYTNINKMPNNIQKLLSNIFSKAINLKDDIFDMNSKYYIKENKNKKKFKNLYSIDAKDNSFFITLQKKSRRNVRQTKILNPFIYVFIFKRIFNNPNNQNESKKWLNTISRYFFDIENEVKSKITNFTKNEFNFRNTSDNAWFPNWQNFKKSIPPLSAEFSYVMITDISNFYDSIYTHSFSWALCGLEDAKRIFKGNQQPNDEYQLGDLIDSLIRSINENETIGIPQGNKISDLLSEVILNRIDLELFRCFKYEKIQILRYKDDYHIFSNDKNILIDFKSKLTKILRRYHLNINEEKTNIFETFPIKFFNKKIELLLPKIISILNTKYIDKEYFFLDLKLFLNEIIFIINDNESENNVRYVLLMLTKVLNKIESFVIEEKDIDEIKQICYSLLVISILDNGYCYNIIKLLRNFLFKHLELENKKELIKKILKEFSEKLKNNNLDDISYINFEYLFKRYDMQFTDSQFTEKIKNKNMWNFSIFEDFSKNQNDILNYIYDDLKLDDYNDDNNLDFPDDY